MMALTLCSVDLLYCSALLPSMLKIQVAQFLAGLALGPPGKLAFFCLPKGHSGRSEWTTLGHVHA